ncbi:MAG TPA: DNA mismatch repair protein, partial [Pirellulales bacterium]|nr:DNA mismatch repair protein [Pirellulales bacterium]
VCGRLLAQSLAPPADFLRWAESDQPAFGPAVIWLARLSALTAALLIAGLALGLLSAELGGTALAALVCANVLFTAIFGGRVYAALSAVAAGAAEARLNHGLYRLAAGFPRDGAILRRIASQVDDAIQQMARLEKLVVLAGLRRWLLLYFPLEFLFLWDFHVVARQERWRAEAGRRYRGWFDCVGELEALCSLAALAHDNPAWCFPEFETEERTIEAAGLGHPLLGESVRVANDVAVGPPGEILMVTGSNMSGKSTLLRSIGVNLVLAQAGGPVCARRMSLPPVELATVMRVSDSLERGVSLFMAELGRLKQVVELVGAANRPERQLCYLLDEILHGTNTAERHLAAVRILHRLATAGAIGAVSTHDLALCHAPELAERCQNVHFQETITQDADRVQMTFDYRLRPGIAQTTNVRFLLDAVGLPALEGEA